MVGGCKISPALTTGFATLGFFGRGINPENGGQRGMVWLLVSMCSRLGTEKGGSGATLGVARGESVAAASGFGDVLQRPSQKLVEDRLGFATSTGAQKHEVRFTMVFLLQQEREESGGRPMGL